MKDILCILIVLGSITSRAQSEYSKYIAPDSSQHRFYVRHKDGGDEKIHYLGVVRKQNGDTSYFVFAVFLRVQAAIVMHGHSTVIFLNKKYKEVESYDVNLPENLPFRLKGHYLYFKYQDEVANKKKTFKFQIQGKLPEILCYSPTECT
ncbi:MAG TPA: hypothetical protein VK553_00580 [Candidatus Nitrosopolaris rasttigaisensis]|nr:hypothetical protein [Candidatus Nitrosopolaris rasttigaisensis]